MRTVKTINAALQKLINKVAALGRELKEVREHHRQKTTEEKK